MNHPAWTSLFLWLGVLAIVLSCAGLLSMRGAAARLHYLTFAGLAAPPLFTSAVLIQDGFSQSGWSAILVTAILILEGPVLAHAIGRSIYTREHKHRRRS